MGKVTIGNTFAGDTIDAIIRNLEELKRQQVHTYQEGQAKGTLDEYKSEEFLGKFHNDLEGFMVEVDKCFEEKEVVEPGPIFQRYAIVGGNGFWGLGDTLPEAVAAFEDACGERITKLKDTSFTIYETKSEKPLVPIGDTREANPDESDVYVDTAMGSLIYSRKGVEVKKISANRIEQK